MICSSKKIRSVIALLLVLSLAVFSSGCEEKKKGITIEAGGQHAVEFEGEKGEVLSIEWKGSGSIMWQLIDDNATKIPGIPQHIIGYETSGYNSIEIHQNATYLLVFENIGTKAITLELKWEIK